MRALAHPARLEIIEYLSQTKEGVTATECAERVGLSPSATSYHLRALAKVGMIQEAPSRGDGRERVWQASYRSYSLGVDKDAGVEAIDAEVAMVETFLARQNERVRRYIAKAREDEVAQWYNVAAMTEQILMIAPDELTELLAKFDELIQPLKRLHREAPPEGAREVSLQIRAVPVD